MEYKALSQGDSDSSVASQSEGDQFYQPKRKTTTSIIVLVLVTLSTVTFISVLVLLGISPSWKSVPCDLPDQTWTVSTRYGHNTSRMSLHAEHDYLWEDFLQDGFGDVHIAEAANEEDKFVGISMFHQLHCLAALRKALQDQSHGKDIGTDEHDDPHWPHCFDYLFQTFLCFADETRERVVPGLNAITGEDTMRTCRDPSTLTDYVCRERQNAIANGWTSLPLPRVCKSLGA